MNDDTLLSEIDKALFGYGIRDEDMIANMSIKPMSLAQSRHHLVNVFHQYAQAYAESIIGQGLCPIICSCDAQVTAMCICTAKPSNDLRTEQRTLNNEKKGKL